ncbi:MAG TPA: hypothetical protein VJV23_01115 [Candidatus Polarisedimenticolia bacterium]|nr:hypothetical protein [Candidatus Polarisedimenticolia bacterium]
MNRVPAALAAAGAAGLLSAGLLAQTAVQGTRTAAYHSPMVVETSFSLTTPSQWDADRWQAGADHGELSVYRCDDIVITEFGMKVHRLKEGRVRVRLRATLDNRGGRDREVSMRAELLKNGTVVAGAEDEVEVEEGDDSGWGVGFQTTEEILTSTPPPRLRLTVNVD